MSIGKSIAAQMENASWIRRMFEALPRLGIEFAKPPYATFGFGALDPAARAAAQ